MTKERINKIIKMLEESKERLESRSSDLDIITTISNPATREAASDEVGRQVDHLIQNLCKILSDEVK